jgi:hypothetical protein
MILFMDRKKREELKKLCETATQGSWILTTDLPTRWTDPKQKRTIFLIDGIKADAELIAAARPAIPDLIAQVDKYESALKSILLQTCLARIFGNVNVSELVNKSAEKALGDLQK